MIVIGTVVLIMVDKCPDTPKCATVSWFLDTTVEDAMRGLNMPAGPTTGPVQ